MSNDVINYLRSNHLVAAKKAARCITVQRSKGGVLVAGGAVVRGILERALTRHYGGGCKPTSVRLSLDEVRAFPLMKDAGTHGAIGWLAVVTDAYGRSAYSIALEAPHFVDPKTRATLAKANATRGACGILLDHVDADLKGSAGEIVN